MKVTKINPNTFTVQLDPEQEPSVVTRRGPAASHINCGTPEAQRYLWDHLEHLAERPSFEDQLFDAKEAKLDYEDLDLRVGTLKGDIERQDRRMAKLEERLEMLSSECATDYRDHENRIASLETDVKYQGANIEDLKTGDIDDDQLHDAIATYIMGKPNALRRAIIDIITDKLS